jgi:hypothetical protein
MAEKPNKYGFSKKEWDDVSKSVQKWIKANEDIWNRMNKYEKDAARIFAKSAKHSKELSASYTAVFDVASKISEELEGQIKTNKLAASIATGMTSINRDMLKIEGKSDALSKRKLKSYQGIVNLTDDFVVNMDAIGTDEFRSLDVNKQIREAKKAGNVEQLGFLENLKLEHDIQKKLNAEINAQADLIKKPFGMLDDMIKRIPIVGDMLSAKLDLTGKGKDMADKFTESARNAITGAKGEVLSWNAFQKSKKGQGLDPKVIQGQYKEHKKGATEGKKGMGRMGVAAMAVGAAIATWGVGMVNFSRDLGVSFSELSVSALLFKEETKALLDEFGSLRDVSNSLLFSMKWQAFWSGAQATDMAKVMMLQQSITTDTKAMALDRQAKFMKEIRKEGLSSSKIMGDLASHADMFAMYAKDGGKNMEEAAKQAASMGLSLDATSAVAEKLLDWESSIAAEMEASMILGRSINLDKARQLAYDGKLVPMMEEVKRQAGGEAEFAKMSVVQRQSLGEAIGLQGAQLAEFMKTEEQRTKELNSGLWKKLGLFTAIATVLGALVGMIVVGIKGMKGSIDLKRGAKQGMGYGLGAGIAGSAAYGIYAKGRASGGPVKAGNPYVVGERGSELFVPTSAGSIIPHAAGGAGPAIDNSDITSRMDKQFEQNERLFRKLGSQFEYGTGQH